MKILSKKKDLKEKRNILQQNIKKETVSKKEIRDGYKEIMTDIHSSAADFVYMFAIFERYLRVMLRVMTRKKIIRNVFEEKWDKFINDKVLSAYHINARDYYKKPEFKYENYELIARADTKNGRDPVNFIETLIGIRGLSEKKGVSYLKHLTSYYWYKEIRNLLVHRGDKFDLTFVKTIKNTIRKTSLNPKTRTFKPEFTIRNLIIAQFNVKKRNELRKRFNCNRLNDKDDDKKYIIKTNLLLDELKEIAVSPNILGLTRSLLFISAWLMYNNNQKTDIGFSSITSPLNAMTSLNRRLGMHLLSFHEELISSLMISCHDSDVNKVADADKLNILIEINLRTEQLIDDINKNIITYKGDFKNIKKEIKKVADLKYERYFKIKNMPSNMQDVLDAFIKGNKNKYKKEILKTNFKEIAFYYSGNKNNVDEDSVREWLLFNKYK